MSFFQNNRFLDWEQAKFVGVRFKMFLTSSNFKQVCVSYFHLTIFCTFVFVGNIFYSVFCQ